MSKQMIKSVVDQFDPIGLLEMICPAEEYDAFVEHFKKHGVNHIGNVFYGHSFSNPCKDSFNQCIDTKVCDAMAYKILSLDAAPADIRGKGHLTPG